MRELKRFAGCAALAIALGLPGSPGRAVTNVYTDSTAFTAALNGSSSYLDALTNIASSPSSPYNSSTVYGYNFVVTPQSGGLKRSSSGPTSLSANTAGKSLTITFPLGGVKAFGARFFLTTSLGALKTGVTNGITVSLNNGTTSTFTPDSASFRGFISDANITEVVITTPSSASNYVTIDDVRLSNNDPPVAVEFTHFPAISGLNANLPTYPEIRVKNGSGATLTSYEGPVAIAITSNTGTSGASLTGTKTVNAVAGIATFDNLQINRTGIGYQLTATAGAATVDSAALNVALATYDYTTTLTSPTASSDGIVYFGDAVGIVHAVNTTTGSVVFDTDITGGNGVAPENFNRQPLGRLTRWTLSGTSRIFCVTSDNYLMVFDLDGNPVLSAALSGSGSEVSASAMVYNDSVYVATSDGSVTTVSKVDGTGAVVAHQRLAGVSTSTVSIFGGSVFLSTPDGSFRLAASDLSVLTAYGAGSDSTAPPFIAATSRTPIAIVVTTGGLVKAFAPNTGAAIGSFGTGGSVDLGIGGSDPKVTAAPFVYGDKIYVGATDNKVYVLNLYDGSPAGPGNSSVFFDAGSYGSGSITAGIGICPYGRKTLVFGSTNQDQFGVNLADPTDAKVYSLGSPINSAPAVDPLTQSVSVAADDGKMYQVPAY